MVLTGNPGVSSIINATNSTHYQSYYINGCGVSGSLDMSMLKSFPQYFDANSNTNLKQIINPTYSTNSITSNPYNENAYKGAFYNSAKLQVPNAPYLVGGDVFPNYGGGYTPYVYINQGGTIQGSIKNGDVYKIESIDKQDSWYILFTSDSNGFTKLKLGAEKPLLPPPLLPPRSPPLLPRRPPPLQGSCWLPPPGSFQAILRLH